MRIGNVNVNGKDHPIVFSTAVAIAVEDKTGLPAAKGLQKILDGGRLSDLFWLLAAMIKAGCAYKRLNGESCEDPISVEDLATLTCVEEYGDLFAEVGEVASGGVRPEIIVEADSKNAEASPSD